MPSSIFIRHVSAGEFLLPRKPLRRQEEEEEEERGTKKGLRMS